MEYGIVLIGAFFVSYFIACHHLKKLEERVGNNQHSNLWILLFAYSMLIYSVVQAGWLTYNNLHLTNLESNVYFELAIAIGLFVSSLGVLTRSKIAWVVATTLSLNIVFWLVNLVYLYKCSSAFKKIDN